MHVDQIFFSKHHILVALIGLMMEVLGISGLHLRNNVSLQ